jgi:hypothetical protein
MIDPNRPRRLALPDSAGSGQKPTIDEVAFATPARVSIQLRRKRIWRNE